MQVSGRVQGAGRTPFYYWTTGLAAYAITFPLAVMLLAMRWKPVMERRDADHRLLGHAVLWALVLLVGMSIPADKKTRYSLPATAAFALVASHLFAEPVQPRLLLWVRLSLRRLCLTLPFAGTLMCCVLACVGHPLVMNGGSWLAAGAACTVLSLLVVWTRPRKNGGTPADDLLALALGAMSFVVICAGVIEPLRLAHNSSRECVAALKAQQSSESRQLFLYRLGPDTDDMTLAADYGAPITPGFIQSKRALSEVSGPAYLICKEEDAGYLPPELTARTKALARGSLTGEPCVLFSLN